MVNCFNRPNTQIIANPKKQPSNNINHNNTNANHNNSSDNSNNVNRNTNSLRNHSNHTSNDHSSTKGNDSNNSKTFKEKTTRKHSHIVCTRVCVCVAIIVIVTKAIQAAAAVDSHKSIYSRKSTLVAHL